MVVIPISLIILRKESRILQRHTPVKKISFEEEVTLDECFAIDPKSKLYNSYVIPKKGLM